jgi:hypothetical protein
MSKGSEIADAEGASTSSKEELIRGLNEDLSREYKAIIQYVVFSSTLKGAEYLSKYLSYILLLERFSLLKITDRIYINIVRSRFNILII